MAVSLNGTNGITFNDSSTQNTAATGFGFKNRIINGAMVVNQRGTQTGSPLNGYTLDRWLFSRSGSGTSTVSQSSSSSYGGRYALNINSAHAAGEVFGIEQRIEAANSADLAGYTVTVQFYASATTSAGALGTFSVALSYATATDNFTSSTSIGSVNFTPTSTPTLFTASFSVPSAATTGLKLQFSGGQITATGTITFNLGSVQLEKGSTATSFDYRPYGTELALCQRYFQIIASASGIIQSGTAAQIPISHNNMRAAPSAATGGVLQITNTTTANYTQSSGNISINENNANGGRYILGNFTGMTSGQPMILTTASSYITLSAEL